MYQILINNPNILTQRLSNKYKVFNFQPWQRVCQQIIYDKKEVVGGPKRRFKQNGYNLDLTYITPRIIAMGFPASGIQKLYRNSIDNVCQALQQRHGNNYLTINLSNRQINQKKLKNVESFEWQDHKVPPLQTLFVICQLIASYLDQQQKRVVAIHCNQGKGRTGTIICCFLIYINHFTNPSDSLNFFSKKRFQKEGYGVTQPCQIKYLEYFANFIKNPQLKYQVICLKKILFKGAHKLKQPYLKLRNSTTNELLFSTKQRGTNLQVEKQNFIQWKIRQKIPFVGDMILQIKDQNKIMNNSIGLYYFNTMFIPLDKYISIGISQISPDQVLSSEIFQENFKIQLYFTTVCSCPYDIEYFDRCQICKQKLIKYQQKHLKIIKSIKTLHQLKNKQQIGLMQQ